ncbi:MAG: MFS transporter [Phycisphaerae bacterium]|nr:MFS transporter [Phycisphaerae bacterium]
MLRALRNRNYRLFFAGQGVSLVGTWMQGVALPWLVYRMTGSVVLLGVVGFTGQILSLVAAPAAGVVADRANRHRLVIAAQVAAAFLAAVLAVLTLTGIIEVWHIIVLSLVGGLIRGFEIPFRQAFVVEMLDDPQDLPNAIALNSFLVNGARLIGPALAGFLVGWFGEGVCFLVNTVSFFAVVVALLAMRLRPRPRRVHTTHPLRDLKEGFLYVAGSPPIRAVLLLMSLLSLLAIPYVVLLPVFARKVLQGGPHTMGFLVAAPGVGAILGAAFLATRRTVLGVPRLLVIASALFGIGVIAFSLSTQLYLSMAFLAVAGFGLMVHMASSNILLQTVADEDKRGRVMGFYTLAFMGMMPLGSLIAGAMAKVLGAPGAVLVCGAASVLASACFAVGLRRVNRSLRPILEAKGLLAHVSGISTPIPAAGVAPVAGPEPPVPEDPPQAGG